jgi:hypothetical protein
MNVRAAIVEEAVAGALTNVKINFEVLFLEDYILFFADFSAAKLRTYSVTRRW